MAVGLRPRRHLDIEGAYNVRDIGGYPARSGKKTRWKTLLRADGLHRLTPASQAALIDYGVRTVIDLRGTNEIQRSPDVFANSSLVAYHHENLMGDALIRERAQSPAVQPGTKDRRYDELYTAILDRRGARMGAVLAILAGPDALPALFHCSAGKDRAGLVTAVVLRLAGVSVETIARDYGLSARHLFERYLIEQAPADVTVGEYTWQHYRQEFCPPHAMVKTLGHLDRVYGGVEAYMRAVGLGSQQISRLRSSIVP